MWAPFWAHTEQRGNIQRQQGYRVYEQGKWLGSRNQHRRVKQTNHVWTTCCSTAWLGSELQTEGGVDQLSPRQDARKARQSGGQLREGRKGDGSGFNRVDCNFDVWTATQFNVCKRSLCNKLEGVVCTPSLHPRNIKNSLQVIKGKCEGRSSTWTRTQLRVEGILSHTTTLAFQVYAISLLPLLLR